MGLLSYKNNNGTAHEIVRQEMAKTDKPPFKRLRLAARSLNAIHKDWREEDVVSTTRQKLLDIMQSGAEPKDRADAGEILGRLGDPRNLEEFIPFSGGRYRLSLGEVHIEPFEIGMYPVTNGWYGKFLEAGGYKLKDYWTPEGLKWLEQTEGKAPRFWYDRQWNCPNAPVIGVSWWEAYAFTAWLNRTNNDGYRYFLPDENQWEAAAAGTEGREYPWGNDWEENRCNYDESGINKTSAVGIFQEGNTPEKIVDLAGNVWEWTCSDFESKRSKNDFSFGSEKVNTHDPQTGQIPMLRGGSWGFKQDDVRCDSRFRSEPYLRDYFIGFRCARTKI